MRALSSSSRASDGEMDTYTLNYFQIPSGSAHRNRQLNACRMESRIRCTDLNTELPISAHVEVSTGAEVAFPIRLQIDSLGAHVHILKRCIDRYTNVGFGLSLLVENMQHEHVRTLLLRTYR